MTEWSQEVRATGHPWAAFRASPSRPGVGKGGVAVGTGKQRNGAGTLVLGLTEDGVICQCRMPEMSVIMPGGERGSAVLREQCRTLLRPHEEASR